MHHSFKVVKGQGVGVCEKYAERLNQTAFTSYPYCNRPEDAHVKGFEGLRRVPLTEKEIIRLFDRVEGLLNQNDEGSLAKLNEQQQRAGRSPTPSGASTAVLAQSEAVESGGTPFFYRYQPPVDINNDGVAENVVVWRPIGQGCGFEQNGSHWRTATKLVALTPGGDLDVANTRQLFAHPKGQEQVFFDPTTRQTKRLTARWFRELGETLSVFRYEGTTYIDAFYARGGDLANERDDQPALPNTLAVFKRNRSALQVTCEILWLNPSN